MKGQVVFIERKASESVSIERVFRQVARDVPGDDLDIRFHCVPYGNGIGAIIKNLIYFKPPAADVYHVTGDIHYICLRLPADRTVLTVHDLIFLRRRTGIRRYVLKKLFLDLPIRRLRHITVVSQVIKDEIIKLTGVDPDRITVIENPLIDGFDAGASTVFNTAQPVVLHIGTAANKNLETLIRAVRGIGCKLRIIGRLNDKVLESLNAGDIVYENVFGLDAHEMVDEYRKADIVSFCSLYEGFGLPILEAQSMHKPVITSDLEPMRSVAGDGAALVDPSSAASIRSALERIINDREYRERLIVAGKQNLRRFDNKSIARQYADVYKKVIGR